MAEKLLTLNGTHLHKEEMYGLAQNIIRMFPMLSKCTDVQPTLANYQAAFDAFDAALSPQRKSNLTNDIHAANQLRYDILRGMNLFLRSLLYDSTLLKTDVEVAEKLNIVYQSYLKKRSYSYTELSGVITNMLADMTVITGYDTIGAKRWTDQLTTAQKTFHDLYMQRANEVSSGKLPKGKTKETFDALVESHRQLTYVINGMVEINPTDVEPFVKQANEAIIKVKAEMKLRKTVAKKRDAATETEE